MKKLNYFILAALSFIAIITTLLSLPASASSFSSLQSFNYPTYYVRHKNSLGFISFIDSKTAESDKDDATWKIVPGLADSREVSFESKNYPGYYLRHNKYRVQISRNDQTDSFKQDATFVLRAGLADRSYLSFESKNYPGYYIRHRRSELPFFELWLEKESDEDLYKKDASFKVVSPWNL